jgi:hypothetical protein
MAHGFEQGMASGAFVCDESPLWRLLLCRRLLMVPLRLTCSEALVATCTTWSVAGAVCDMPVQEVLPTRVAVLSLAAHTVLFVQTGAVDVGPKSCGTSRPGWAVLLL